MNYSIEITGGIGYHIMATSFIKWLNEKYPKSKINVVSAYPEIFEYNPRIYRNLKLDQPYLFEDYVKNTDYRVGRPYRMYEFYNKKEHLMKIFPKAFRFNKYNEKPESDIYLTKGEEMDGQVFNKQNSPLITFQPFGGLPSGAHPNRMKLDSSQRDIPPKMAQKIVNLLVQKGYKVLQIKGPTEMPLQNTIQLELPFRNILPIIKHSKGHIGIDSSGMHASAVFKKPMLIFWGQTHKDNLGYNYDEVINAYNEFGMHCRPNIQMPDRGAVYPIKNKNEGFEFNYDDSELGKYIEEFLNKMTEDKK